MPLRTFSKMLALNRTGSYTVSVRIWLQVQKQSSPAELSEPVYEATSHLAR